MFNSKAQWIWYNGDFEIYHSMLLHSRREELGHGHPCIWSIASPFPLVRFHTSYHSDAEDTLRLVTRAIGYIDIDGVRVNAGDSITVPSGDHKVKVVTTATAGFPSIYINSKYLKTGADWCADHGAFERIPVGTWDAFADENDDPAVFPFEYKRIDAVSITEAEEGTLYDFGEETFGKIIINGADPESSIRVVYGESREEALDPVNAIIRESVSGKESYELVPRAFRYVCVRSSGQKLTVYAEHEYLPLEYKGSFRTSNERVNKIWDVCAHTLHLNSREFFIDGIKRDRWCWSGDAYQSFMANNYIFFDPEITKRTIIALLGKPPYVQHVNTINDYSAYLIIAAYDYYYATGDTEFIKIYYPRIKALYDFINSRLDDKGYVCYRPGDWIFIDWADMDKSGALCAEQILLWKCRCALAELSRVIGIDGSEYDKSADRLKRSIMRDFWREEKGAFIDCFESGKENVTRHANVFAIMYDFVTPARARKIKKMVLDNDNVTAITTPYFEFFELCAVCKMGGLVAAQRKIDGYWGGMIDLGATSIWEEFDPKKQGIEHYAMYGKKFGCSLCHAWGGGPIYLLGRYSLGVYPTSVAYATYNVEPHLGDYDSISGTVPMAMGGEVRVYMDKSVCRVSTNREGGTLILRGKRYELPVGEFSIEL